MVQPPSRLRETRKLAGLTQQALADLVGVRQPHIARWESGAHEPRARMAIRLASALGTTVELIWSTPDTEATANVGSAQRSPRDVGASGGMAQRSKPHGRTAD